MKITICFALFLAVAVVDLSSTNLFLKKSAELGSPCNVFTNCKDPSLICDTGKTNRCICAPKFVQEENVCLPAPGESCNIESVFKPPCASHANCTDRICKCDSGYEKFYQAAIANYKCLPLDGSPCDGENDVCPATTGLHCRGQVCECSDGYEWSAPYVKCLSKVNKECDPKSSQRTCVANAVCSNGFCKCAGGYTRTKANTCQRKQGSTCNHFETVSTERCNADEYLECGPSKTCQCLEGKAVPDLESSDKICRFLPGQRCDPPGSIGEFQRTCIEYLECIKGDSGIHTCRCKSGFEHGKVCQINNSAMSLITYDYIMMTLLFGLSLMG